MAIPSKNVLGNPNVTEGNFQIAIEQLRESVIGSGKAYDSTNTYMQYDTCVYNGITYYSKINSNTGNTPSVGVNWGLIGDLFNPLITNGTALGYGTGSGGIVTQLTSKSTTVTLNKPTGQIIMNNAALASNTWVGFAVINSNVTGSDIIIVNAVSGSTVMNLYEVKARPQDGSIAIDIRHSYPSSLTDAMVIEFAVIKGAIA